RRQRTRCAVARTWACAHQEGLRVARLGVAAAGGALEAAAIDSLTRHDFLASLETRPYAQADNATPGTKRRRSHPFGAGHDGGCRRLQLPLFSDEVLEKRWQRDAPSLAVLRIVLPKSPWALPLRAHEVPEGRAVRLCLCRA